MKKYLLPESGKFYKANLHLHTTISDGKMTPEEVKQAYMEQGYSILAYTDHEVIVPHPELCDENFLAITSYEIATNKGACPGGFNFEQTYHINLYALAPDCDCSPVFEMARLWPPHSINYMTDEAKSVNWHREYSVESLNKLIAKANESGFIVSYNHPVWSQQSYADYAGLRGLWGVEWHNHGCVLSGYPDTMQPIDDLLKQNERVFPLATDDSHSARDCFGGYVMVKADSLEYGTVMNAFINGDFYSSTGPEIKDLYLEDGFLHIKTSPAARILVSTERRIRFSVYNPEGEEAIFDLNGYMSDSRAVKEKRCPSYFRVTVYDTHSNQAQTRAFFEDEWE